MSSTDEKPLWIVETTEMVQCTHWVRASDETEARNIVLRGESSTRDTDDTIGVEIDRAITWDDFCAEAYEDEDGDA